MELNVTNVKLFYDSEKVTEVKLQSLESLLHDTTHNTFEKFKDGLGVIQYPINVIEGLSKIIRWESVMDSKIGISSESISRHSVTYSKSSEKGYPDDLTSFMALYTKARF